MDVGKFYTIFTTDDEGNQVKLKVEYLGFNEDDVDCFRINGRIVALDSEEYYLYDPKDNVTVAELIKLLSKQDPNKLVRFELDDNCGTALVTVPGTVVSITEDGDTIVIAPEKVVEQDY